MMALAADVGMFAVIISLLRRQKMELKYCLIWFIALVGIAVFCISPGLLDRLSLLLGISTPINTFFLICIAFLACICISLTVVVSNLSNKIRELSQNVAIMEHEKEDTKP